MFTKRTIFLCLLLVSLSVLLLMPQSTNAAVDEGTTSIQTALNAPPPPGGDTPKLGKKKIPNETEGDDFLLQRDDYYLSRRLAGTQPLSISEAADQLFDAADESRTILAQSKAHLPNAYGGTWTAIGPNPIVQNGRTTNAFEAVSGRIGALVVRSDGRRILGSANGGIWVWNTVTSKWDPQTDFLQSLAIGALAMAPSNENIMYAGTGEGALSGDSVSGNGVLKSTDGGISWAHVSGKKFRGVSTSRIVIDPTNPDHLWIAILRGRGGNRRVTRPPSTDYGIYESTDGGANWTLLKAAPAGSLGATDLEIDPQNAQILYASFWSDAIYKSTDGGQHWHKIMTGLPANANYAAGATRFSIAISHPPAPPHGAVPVVTLYVGFDYVDNTNTYHPARVWKSTNEGASWSILPAGSGVDKVEDYCGTQCFYDNVIEVDPTDANVVFAAGSYGYSLSPQSGGIFRSLDGGATWKNLGSDLHPDFHALAFNPATTANVLIGNDGGVWYSANRGGRLGVSDPLTATTWVDLNGTVDPNSAVVTAQTNLQITQFTSIANNPTLPERFWGGSQDNGTERKTTAVGATRWFDVASGDGGQVLVDPTDFNYVYGTYFGISPYRFTDSGLTFFSNQFITNGIDLGDRAEFYVPFAMNQNNPEQLYLGTYRMYRTDNAKAASSGDVLWQPISGDLTSGCPGTAPNGARGCFISAIGVSRANGGVWVGTDDALVWYSPNASTSLSPQWTQVGQGVIPNRPVQSIAVDNSDYRVAYVALGGFNKATPGFPGHLFKTTDAGATFTNISGNLPNSPLDWVILDPSFPDTLYAGTDVGIFVTNNGGGHWDHLGTGFPIVSVWQMDLDPLHRTLLAGTHGRGAWKLTDASTLVPALVLSKQRPVAPVGPGTNATLTLTVQNIGNATATGVRISDFLPDHTSFVSADSGGTLQGGDHVVWSGITVPSNSSVTVHMTVHIANNASGKITNDHYLVKSNEVADVHGSPLNIKLAPAHAVSISPTSQQDGTRAGQDLDYTITVHNNGFMADKYNLSVTGNAFPTSFLDATCTTPETQTGTINAGDTEDVCVRVSVPGGATNGTTDTATVKATSDADPSVSATATIKTIAVTDNILLVDEDGDSPNVQSYYTTALNTYGQPYNVWDLGVDANLPPNYMKAHKAIVWFTGNSYPGPITPYEARLKGFLDNGGHLFMSGQDILDQAAGTTTFVHDYLHVDWDGSETQNDKATANVTGVSGNPVTGSIGTITINHSVLGAAFEDRITPISPATHAFTDDTAADDGLTVIDTTTNTYKVLFIAFPFEAYGSASDKATLMADALNWFGP